MQCGHLDQCGLIIDSLFEIQQPAQMHLEAIKLEHFTGLTLNNMPHLVPGCPVQPERHCLHKRMHLGAKSGSPASG